ncbi:MAG TPA: sulfate adenylyltransferase, partial [Solibacterales bacterium]|nr:sulfate adenylyltransferase [Bryobacterales bacterium]
MDASTTAATAAPYTFAETQQEQTRDLLRLSTAGSVDDGKSTLIGRLLYDSRAVYEDQVAAVSNRTVNGVAGAVDFALLTDGLRAEREQG